MKVLLIVEQCNPEGYSIPLIGFNFFKAISQVADVTLVTSARHQENFKHYASSANIVFIPEGIMGKMIYRLASFLTRSKTAGWNWGLRHALSYPSYYSFDKKVLKRFKSQVSQFDIVHAIPPILPRFPVSLAKYCHKTPFILGPVNGGIPFPEGFKEVAVKEHADSKILKQLAHRLPGYKKTYQLADKILVGSQYTQEYLLKTLHLNPKVLTWLSENGVEKEFFYKKEHFQSGKPLELLCVGRLVPYKQNQLVIEAMARLKPDLKEQVRLTILGEGPQQQELHQLVQTLGLVNQVKFCRWVKQTETREYFRAADVFCMPSVREFGGAVVLEAMACSLPCLVVDYGGIAEYVTEKCGFKIPPLNAEKVIEGLKLGIETFLQNGALREKMAVAAFERAQEFSWENKGKTLLSIYNNLMNLSP